MNPLPLTGAKIHRPLLRADVLTRERLNGWLENAVMGRLALIVAEAGFGKTTLLADWSRHTKRLTAWYRLESDDRDWLTFLRHLVGGGRELDPAFAQETYALLMQLGPGGPTQAELVASLVREIAEFGAAHSPGFTLIFDDYHVIDRSEETEPIVRALIDRTGPGFSVILASRAAPKLPLGRLRARGGVARLDGDALCFDVPEADRLFRDAYHQPLEPDIIADLIARTEGWPALLSLVRTNLEGASPAAARQHVAELSAAAGDLYDFVVEEVIDRLPPDLGEFMLRASMLDELDIEAAAVIVDSPKGDIVTWLEAAEGLGLTSRPDASSGHRVIPLVRQALEARLVAAAGRDRVREMNLALAGHFERSRWRTAATHYERAGDSVRAGRVIEQSLDEILGGGNYRAAVDLLSATPGNQVVQNVLRSRLQLQIGAVAEALASATSAVNGAEGATGNHLASALRNAASIAIGAHEYEVALSFARRAATDSLDLYERELSETYVEVLGASGSSSLPALALRLERLLESQRRRGHWHYAAITCLNLAQVLVWLDRPLDALRAAGNAERLLQSSSQGYELVSVRLVQAQAKAHLGQWTEAEHLIALALDTAHPEGQLEAVFEAACAACWYGPYELAAHILARVRREALPAGWAPHWRVLDIWAEDALDACARLVEELPENPTISIEVGAAFRWHLTVARSHLGTGDRTGFTAALAKAETTARLQQSPLQSRLAALLRTIASGGDALTHLFLGWPSNHDPVLGVFATEICGLLGELPDPALIVVSRAAIAQPHRWRKPLREHVVSRAPGSHRAALILEQVGEEIDVQLLREYGRRSKRSGRGWGDDLIRRLAPRVAIEDLGLMWLRVGEQSIDGRAVRRKVLALLAFLASQPGGSATPDQVLEALWPDLDPEQGANSLHQTIYFLRRVIDPSYRAGFSAEYLHFDPEVIWLDQALVDTRSWDFLRLLAQRPETPREVEALLETYRGKFAADFAYEDWAAAYRERLHASYLAVIERAVGGDIGAADLHWRLWVGQQALTLDPEADVVEAHVIHLYRELGAPAAAAEQYAHYSAVLRDQLGIDPPPLEDV